MVNGSSHTQNKGQTDRETDDRATIHKYRFVSNQVDLCCVYPARNPETHPPRATNTEQQMNIANSLNIVLAFRCEQIRIAVPVCPHRVCVFAKSANELRLCLHSVIRTGQDQGSVHIGMRTPPRGIPLCPSPHPPPLCVINARQVLRFGRLSNIYQKLQTIQNKKIVSSSSFLLPFLLPYANYLRRFLFVSFSLESVKQLIQYLISQQ